MQLKKIKTFKADHEICSDYCIYQNLSSAKLFLFRKIPARELIWYVFERNENYYKDLMAVKLQEVNCANEAEKLVKEMWDTCKCFKEGRKKND